VVIVSAHIQAEDSFMSWRSSARLSRRQKVTLNHPIFTRRRGFRLLANELARRESLDQT
jgi:hypothetical protein